MRIFLILSLFSVVQAQAKIKISEAYDTKVDYIKRQEIVASKGNSLRIVLLCNEGDEAIAGNCAVPLVAYDQGLVSERSFTSKRQQVHGGRYIEDGFSCVVNGQAQTQGIETYGEILVACSKIK